LNLVFFNESKKMKKNKVLFINNKGQILIEYIVITSTLIPGIMLFIYTLIPKLTMYYKLIVNVISLPIG